MNCPLHLLGEGNRVTLDISTTGQASSSEVVDQPITGLHSYFMYLYFITVWWGFCLFCFCFLGVALFYYPRFCCCTGFLFIF